MKTNLFIIMITLFGHASLSGVTYQDINGDGYTDSIYSANEGGYVVTWELCDTLPPTWLTTVCFIGESGIQYRAYDNSPFLPVSGILTGLGLQICHTVGSDDNMLMKVVKFAIPNPNFSTGTISHKRNSSPAEASFFNLSPNNDEIVETGSTFEFKITPAGGGSVPANTKMIVYDMPPPATVISGSYDASSPYTHNFSSSNSGPVAVMFWVDSNSNTYVDLGEAINVSPSFFAYPKVNWALSTQVSDHIFERVPTLTWTTPQVDSTMSDANTNLLKKDASVDFRSTAQFSRSGPVVFYGDTSIPSRPDPVTPANYASTYNTADVSFVGDLSAFGTDVRGVNVNFSYKKNIVEVGQSSNPVWLTFAHELIHGIANVGHSSDPNELMFGYSGGEYISESQAFKLYNEDNSSDF